MIVLPEMIAGSARLSLDPDCVHTAVHDVGALLLMRYPSGSAKMTFFSLESTGNGLTVRTRSFGLLPATVIAGTRDSSESPMQAS